VLFRSAARERRYERAAWLRRRHERLEDLLGRLGGVLRATHARSRLVLAPHPHGVCRFDTFWLVAGRVADWVPARPLPPRGELRRRTHAALATAPEGRVGDPATGAFVPPDEVDEVRIVAGWLAAHEEVPVLDLEDEPEPAALHAFVHNARASYGVTAA